MRYREGLPLVLKNISFEVKPQEKIGIVGRTGSGRLDLRQNFILQSSHIICMISNNIYLTI